MRTGEFLKRRRMALKLSLRAAAKELGVDPAYLSQIEAEQVSASEQIFVKLADTLHVPKDELLLLARRVPSDTVGEKRAIEDGFPFELLSDVAEVESWRKEIYRPVYHLHKWWAQRLGSVFRAIIIGGATPAGSGVMDLIYEPVRLPNFVVFDPFMGSGTTVGEALKLGAIPIGRDINPVACRSVTVALSRLSRDTLLRHYAQLDETVGREIRSLYRGRDRYGSYDCLYYFWVKWLPCPECGEHVDLFSKRIFAQHAYPTRCPEVQILCPDCGEVFCALYTDRIVDCPACGIRFDSRLGPVDRSKATCTACGSVFPVARTAALLGKPPDHRLYAKLVLREDGSKSYARVTGKDERAYADAAAELKRLGLAKPIGRIKPGHNTRQVLSFGYTSWDQFFNERQHLALGLLGQGIRHLPEGPERDAMGLLFSGALEFNNMFASYKGEGTGAVRHMFSHHVLKPERTPIEANVWGTPKSSGSFSTMFKSRLLRALDYKEAPFEVAVGATGGRKQGRKVFGASPPMEATVIGRYPRAGLRPGMVYLSQGDSARTDLPARVVDLVVTDPPFFDNVHYSELADFFHLWQVKYIDAAVPRGEETTRRAEEVQDCSPEAFSAKLGSVLRECHRVLKDEGLLILSYHHSRPEGWRAVMAAVLHAGFTFVQAHPVKAEMSVATPKSQARSPIDLDVILVCRKRDWDESTDTTSQSAIAQAETSARESVRRFNARGRVLSENDVRVVLMSALLVRLSAIADVGRALESLEELEGGCERRVRRLWRAQEPKGRTDVRHPSPRPRLP